MITADQLRAMARGRPNESNLNSMLVALNAYGPHFGLDKPHRLAHFLPHVLHETGAFRWDSEIWGPTAAQKRYDTRTDLGNTPAKDGDGKRYRGRGPFHLTGRANYRAFTKWARSIDPAAPNFETTPDAVNTDPWEGLSALWYWDSRNINRYADQNNIEMVTRAINGGLNGYAERLEYYGRVALVLLGYGTSKAEIERFQREHPDAGMADGLIGQRTRMALHRALKGTNPYEERVPVPVDRPTIPHEVEDEVKRKTTLWGLLSAFFGGSGASGAMLFGMQWQTVAVIGATAVVMLLLIVLLRKQLIGAVKDIREVVEGRA